MSSTICYSAINPRPLKKHKVHTSKVGVLAWYDDVDIIDVEKKIVNIKKKPKYENIIDTSKLAQSFLRSSGIKALAKRVAFSDLNTIYDDSGNIVDATKLPTNLIEATDMLNAGKTAKANFSLLPNEITKGMSPEDFVKNYKQEDVLKAINDFYANAAKSKENNTNENIGGND